MVSFYRLSQRRLPALIAIVAVLLLFIAPDVSKTLESYRVTVDSGISAHCHAGMMMDNRSAPAMPDGSVMMHADPTHAMPHQRGSDSDTAGEFACGYCQLLVHMPLLACLFAAFLWLMCTIARTSPAMLPPAFHATVFPGTCQPRAPPRL